MKGKKAEELLARLIQECGLGEITGEVESISGGFLHRMYKVVTPRGVYAVKHLNGQIMKRPDARDNFVKAEKLEEVLEKNDIPIVPALCFGGKKMQTLEGEFFYIFKWQTGNMTDWNHISCEDCYKVGNILGKMHAIKPEKTVPRTVTISQIDWQAYIRQAKETDPETASLLENNEALLIYGERELNKARALLPAMSCISDEDMDPKNVMWDRETPWIIDLECLDYGNPMSHALQLGLQWSGITVCELDPDRLAAFFDGYLQAYDNCFRGYGDIAGVAYTWVEWLEYNIQRVLGNCMDETERELGIREVRNTINRIACIHEKEALIRETLRTRLRRVDASRYDNHDERVCYYKLLLEKDLFHIPRYSLPAGYKFVPYSEGDRDAWIAIEKSAKEFSNDEQGLEAWNRYYANSLDILPRRMFFVENDKGEKVATGTAFYDIYGKDQSGDGWLHWVAVKREYQGKGISKPLITHVLNVMKELGYTHAKIPTQTNTWLACKIYLNLGFRPVKENLEQNYEGWKIISELTRR